MVKGFLNEKSNPSIEQNIVKFATIDGKSVDVDV